MMIKFDMKVGGPSHKIQAAVALKRAAGLNLTDCRKAVEVGEVEVDPHLLWQVRDALDPYVDEMRFIRDKTYGKDRFQSSLGRLADMVYHRLAVVTEWLEDRIKARGVR